MLVCVKVDDKGCQEYLIKDVCEILYVEFGFDKVEVCEIFYLELEGFSDKMYQYLFVDLIFEGYIDSIGFVQYNQQLFEKCVDVVKCVMVEEFGIDESWIIIEGYGEVKLIVDNSICDGCVQNCCVEVIMKVIIEEVQYDNK